MNIGIDCRLGGTTHAGIGRYTEQLVYEVTQLKTNCTWVLFFYDEKQIKQSKLFSEVIQRPNVVVCFTPITHYTLAEQLFLPLYWYRHKLDLIHVPHFNVPLLYFRKKVVTIHDLLWHHYQGTSVTTLPKYLYWLKYIGYRIVAQNAIRSAQTIFVPANQVKQDLLAHFPRLSHKVVVTYEGVSVDHLTSDVFPSIPKQPYLLYVGSLYPHKNVSIILDALSKDTSLHLAIAGSRTVFQDALKEKINQQKLAKQVTFLGFVPDGQLASVYKKAIALIQPSFSEGFGLTGMEAFALETPVIASNIPIFQELYKDHAFLFNPHSVDELSKHIQTVQSLSPVAKSKRIQKAKAYAQTFQWNTMAKKTVPHYVTAQTT